MPKGPPAAGRMTSFVRVQRPDPDSGRDESGQPTTNWLTVAECWAVVSSLPAPYPLPERAGASVGVTGRRVTVHRDAVPGAEEGGTRWRVVLIMLDGRLLASPPPVLAITGVAAPDGLTVTFDCHADQRAA